MAGAGTRLKDYRRALELTNELLVVDSFLDLQQVILPALTDLIGASSSTYHHFTLRPTNLTEVVVTAPAGILTAEDFAEYAPFVGTHPIVRSFLESPALLEPRSTSQITSLRGWYRTEAYQRGHRALGVDDQLAILLGKHGAETVGLSLSRSGARFTSRDRELLSLLGEHLVRSVRRATACGGPALMMAPVLRPHPLPPPPAAADGGEVLTPREREVVGLVARGLTSRMIGRTLGITEKTVGKHLEHIYAKLGVTDRVSAMTALRGAASSPSRAWRAPDE
jgi:DNA-binding CsgD family transcriptional regulator